MGNWTPKYTKEQKLAVEQAWFIERIRPARRIVGLAALDKLNLEGEPVGAFTMPLGTLNKHIADTKRRQAGQLRKELANQTPQDATETFRRRLLALLDREFDKAERLAKKRDELVPPVHLKQLASVIKELASIPEPKVVQPTNGKPSSGPKSELAQQLRQTMRQGQTSPQSTENGPLSPPEPVEDDSLQDARVATLQALRVAVE